MARKKLIEVDEAKVRSNHLSELSELVARWGSNKSTADNLKKDIEADAAKIKQIMIDEELEESESGGFLAKLSFQNKESMDEEGLLKFIKSVLWNGKGSMECPYIERIEVINFDALEKAMYEGTISKEQVLEMNKFKIVTRVPVLKLKKEGK